jgi:hypothetical protein
MSLQHGMNLMHTDWVHLVPAAAAAAGIVRKPMTAAARLVARQTLRKEVKKAKARRPTNPNYARLMGNIIY